jgi:uncharacterized RDD family membrane protein YckC
MNNDNLNNEIDSLLDDFDFKPITEGLGFHHSLKDKKEVKVNLKAQSVALKSDLEERAKVLKKTAPKAEQKVNMGDLSPFYANNTSKEVQQEIKISESVAPAVKVKEANIVTRFFAWAIDMIMLVAIMLVTITGILFATEMPMEILNIFMLSDDLLVSFAAISAMFYIFYFSFLDKTNYSTAGKRMMGIKVESNSKRLTIIQTFFRTVVCMLSIVTFGLAHIVKIQDKITNTKVVNA